MSETQTDLTSLRNELANLCSWREHPVTKDLLSLVEFRAAGNHQVAEHSLTSLALTAGGLQQAKEYRNELLDEARGLRFLQRHVDGRIAEINKTLKEATENEQSDSSQPDDERQLGAV